MARLLLTVQDLVDQVRNQVDEQDQDAVSLEGDILPVLNRAQDYAYNILARKYQEPLLTYTQLTLTSGQEYDIPEDAFEDRIEKIEIQVSGGLGSVVECQRISFRDISNYESSSRSNVPYYYCVVGRKIRFVPGPTGTYNARIWYLKSPERLVLPLGRITRINTAGNYLLVESPSTEISTEADRLEAYVNIIDGQTGIIKGTLQVQNVNDTKISFRSTPTRAHVLNRTINTSLADLGIEPDDYLARVSGTCVPYYGQPTTNFLIQFSVAEITRKLGGSSEKEDTVLEKFEKQLERTWVGRETTLRVSKKSQSWIVSTRNKFWE
jgi:hypothetical protein